MARVCTRLMRGCLLFCHMKVIGIHSKSSILPFPSNTACHPLAQPPHQLSRSLQSPVNAQAPAGSPSRTKNSTRFTNLSAQLALMLIYLQFAGTLASVRKVRPGAILEELEQSGEGSGILHRHGTFACHS